jgi:steroid delta-isomerase-like uncharacterized protein
MQTATPEKITAIMRKAYGTLQNGGLEAAAELLTEDFIANLPGLPEPLHGREIWKQGARSMLEAFPDLRIEIEDMFAAGNKVAVRVRIRGTHQGPFEGVPATHREVDFRSLELYRLEGDKIAEEWVAPDMISLMQQISGPAES